jgi:hypothetical protein
MTVIVIGVVFAGFIASSLWWTAHKEKGDAATTT